MSKEKWEEATRVRQLTRLLEDLKTSPERLRRVMLELVRGHPVVVRNPPTVDVQLVQALPVVEGVLLGTRPVKDLRGAVGLLTLRRQWVAARWGANALVCLCRKAPNPRTLDRICHVMRVGVRDGLYYPDMQATDDQEVARQVRVVRDVLGNPYQPYTPDPVWGTPDVVALARAVRGGDLGSLTVLADALLDAGCGDQGLLTTLQEGEVTPGNYRVHSLAELDPVARVRAPRAGGSHRGKYDILGHSVVSVLRWMGARGFTRGQAEQVLAHYGVSPSPTTVGIQLRVGRAGEKAPAQLAPAEEASLLAVGGLA